MKKKIMAMLISAMCLATATLNNVNVVSAADEEANVPITMGDVNDDGSFNVADVVLLQKWLLAVPNTDLANWKAADFYDDQMLNVFDLCLMKRALIEKMYGSTELDDPEIREILFGYPDSGSASSAPMSSIRLAMKCKAFCPDDKKLTLDVAMLGLYEPEGYDENTFLYNYSICPYTYEDSKPIEDKRLIINDKSGNYIKEYVGEDREVFNVGREYNNIDTYHHETASLNFENYSSGSSGKITFIFKAVFLNDDGTLPEQPQSEGYGQTLYYYVGDDGVGISNVSIEDAEESYKNKGSNEVPPLADPVTPVTAQPISYKDMDSAIDAIKKCDISAYPNTDREEYRKMFELFNEDKFIYHFTDAENTITLREDHPNSAIWLMPYANYEDMGILYHVVYQGKYYQVYYYFTDSAYPAANLWDYLEQRLNTKQINVVDEKYGIVDNSNDEQSAVSAYFAIDDTHYCKVKTFEQEDALMDFLQVLNYEKLDIADNSEVFVPVNSSDTDLDKSAIAGKIFAYEKEGAGGYCTLSFNENGRFLYSPGKLSSYMDGGDWKIDGDTVSLIGMENKTIYLKITDDTLVYIAEGSDEFPYMDIKDGEKFVIYRPEISADKFQLNSRYSEYGLGDPKVELDLIVSELPEFCYVEDVRLYDEDDNFIGMMSPAMDADIWSYLVDCNITEECSKTYYTLSKIRCGEKTYLDDVRSEITVNFKVAPAP